jgi:hypothetical protein
MGMGDFQFLLSDLATAFREDALWQYPVASDRITADGRLRITEQGDQIRATEHTITIPGRFRIDPFEAPLGNVEPGLGETQIWFYCDRAIVPQPFPVLGDTLTIRGQIYEIVQRDEDDIGELGFRLIRRQIGISTVTSEGAYSSDDQPVAQPLTEVMPRPAVVPVAAPETSANRAGRPSRRREIAAAFDSAVATGAIDPARPLKELCAVMHQRLGNGGGLSSRTLRRVVGGLVRERRERARAGQ